MHFLVLAWGYWHMCQHSPRGKNAVLKGLLPNWKRKFQPSLNKACAQRFATQFRRPNEFEDDWNKHWNFGSSCRILANLSVSFVVLPFTDANSTGLLLTKIIECHTKPTENKSGDSPCCASLIYEREILWAVSLASRKFNWMKTLLSWSLIPCVGTN